MPPRPPAPSAHPTPGLARRLTRRTRTTAAALVVAAALAGVPGTAATAGTAAATGTTSSTVVSPSGTTVQPPLSRKKGVASYAYLSSDVGKVAALQPSWSYNWTASRPADMAGMEFVPMLWGASSVTDDAIRRLQAGARAGEYTTLLGFNEPDLSEQARMTPEEAIALWPRLEATGLRLASPVPASPWNGWLDRFMDLADARGSRVDVLALHYYQDFTDPRAVERLREELATLHARYGRPIWITEIGAIDLRAWGMQTYAPATHERADTYMREVVALLESLPYVERYAWFDDNCWHAVECRYSSLYDDRGALTSHGTTYARASQAPLRPRAITARSSLENDQWGAWRADDGALGSRPGSRGYTSDAHGGPRANEWVALDLGRRARVSGVVLHPRTFASDEWPGDRTAGAGFPVDFTIQVSDDGAAWRTVRTVTGHPDPGERPQSFSFAATDARWVRVDATVLGRPTTSESWWGGYRLQLAEIAVRPG